MKVTTLRLIHITNARLQGKLRGKQASGSTSADQEHAQSGNVDGQTAKEMSEDIWKVVVLLCLSYVQCIRVSNHGVPSFRTAYIEERTSHTSSDIETVSAVFALCRPGILSTQMR